MPPTTAIPNSFRRARCWSPAPARSGAQIAEELLQAGRRVYLSVGRHRRLPRRYRGRDLIWWLAEMRLDQVTPEERGPARLGPVIPAPMAAAPSISATSPPTA